MLQEINKYNAKCIAIYILINKNKLAMTLRCQKNLKISHDTPLIILPDSFIRYHYPPMLTFAFPVNIAPDVEPANLVKARPWGFNKGAWLYISSRVNLLPGALFHHTRDILLIV